MVPNASRTELKGLHGSALRIRVAAPPEGGRANAEVCRLLAELSGFPAEVVSGTTSRSKRVLLRGADRRRLAATLV